MTKPRRKPTKITVNISSSSVHRARCKFCGKGPDDTYAFYPSKHITKSPKKNSQFHATRYQPEFMDGKVIADVSVELNASFAPTFHCMNKCMTKRRSKIHLRETVYCPCYLTKWIIKEQSVANRPETINRRGRYGYPKSFET